MAADDDLALLAAWRGGDPGAGQRLVERHFASICRFFRAKLGDDVGDLVQQTFADCLAGRDEIAVSFRAFLFQIARRRLFDHLRTHYQVRDQQDVAALSLADLGTDAPTRMARHQREQALLDAMAQLPLDDRILLELTYWDGLSAPEVAAVVGSPANTVRGDLSRARAALRDLLEADDASWEQTLTEFSR
ncbi:MAG: sigma-70 family RNA polymerase sigma factor [Kofleriaceae bacterium]|nr:sigma-70 family RNA polymerase sigma factor [Kofleriaceae bacterium]MBP6840619.1 sigma-70 family RNA polymerase sigma factor [Kofleriaceae bacterium]MBP9202636.1 sigma-70 family RNA polymerase sigma factor [Kofleriaceae bacterium]